MVYFINKSHTQFPQLSSLLLYVQLMTKVIRRIKAEIIKFRNPLIILKTIFIQIKIQIPD